MEISNCYKQLICYFCNDVLIKYNNKPLNIQTKCHNIIESKSSQFQYLYFLSYLRLIIK